MSRKILILNCAGKTRKERVTISINTKSYQT